MKRQAAVVVSDDVRELVREDVESAIDEATDRAEGICRAILEGDGADAASISVVALAIVPIETGAGIFLACTVTCEAGERGDEIG